MISEPAPPPVFGPLPVKVQTGLSGLSFLPEPTLAQPLSPGERRWFSRLDLGNNATYHGTTERFLYSDLEQTSLRVGTQQGTAWGEWSAGLTLQSRSGGILDPLIGWWHKNIVPFSDVFFSREPYQQVRVQVFDGANQLYDSGGAVALTQLTLQAKRTLGPGLSGQVFAKLPLSGTWHYLDNGTIDVGAGLIHRWEVRNLGTLHTNLNLVRAGTTTVGPLRGGHRFLFSHLVALERPISSRTALVAQAENTAFPFNRDLTHQGDRLRQMSFGAWTQTDPQTRWHLSFSENIYPFQVTSYTPDIMVSLGIVRRR